MMTDRTDVSMRTDVDDRIVGDCHYCGEPVVNRFAGQWGPREVWVRVHETPSATDHHARTSEEVWAEEDGFSVTDSP